MKRISQREARGLRKRVTDLEAQIKAQRQNWSSDWPGGVHIGTLKSCEQTCAKIQVARKLGHAVVATDSGDEIEFRALPLPAEPA